MKEKGACTYSMKNKIFLIDDDPISIFINRTIVTREYPSAIIEDYLSVSLAVDAIKEKHSTDHLIIFLDLNMPGISGWDFIELLEKDCPDLNYSVYILTSSNDESDRIRSGTYKTVKAFLQKPLLPARLAQLNLEEK